MKISVSSDQTLHLYSLFEKQSWAGQTNQFLVKSRKTCDKVSPLGQLAVWRWGAIFPCWEIPGPEGGSDPGSRVANCAAWRSSSEAAWGPALVWESAKLAARAAANSGSSSSTTTPKSTHTLKLKKASSTNYLTGESQCTLSCPRSKGVVRLWAELCRKIITRLLP